MSSRQELIEKFAKKANLPKRNAGAYLGIILEVIQLILAKSGELKLPGFGAFKARQIPEREGTNPLTKKKVTFAAGVRVSFKPGRPFKQEMLGGSFAAKAEKAKAGKSGKRKK
ncbi:MAG: DNA-binding protein [Desulfobacteraceae bacterium]|nr:MAG: DNA-binding protein [Desulfobacteraceae bacterium]